MSTDLHKLVQSGFADAMTYDTHRPSYPLKSVTLMLNKLGILDAPGARILEIGAGTGKLTEQLVGQEKNYDILAVEPHAPMRAVLEQKSLPGVRVVDATAANLGGVEDAWADAVVVGQAFHWFANIEALQEIHRVIKPYGKLALLWNFEDYNSGVEWKSTSEWEDTLKQFLWPNDNQREWQAVFQEQPHPALYSAVEGDIHQWTVWLSKEAVWDRFRTMSPIASQGSDDFEEAKKVVFKALDGHDVEKDETGKVALHGRTELFWTTALPARLKNSTTSVRAHIQN